LLTRALGYSPTSDRPIYLCRPGHSEFIESLLSPRDRGGSPRIRTTAAKLSDTGERFARHLKDLFDKEFERIVDTETSQLRVYTWFVHRHSALQAVRINPHA
jgi:hypothetical protein